MNEISIRQLERILKYIDGSIADSEAIIAKRQEDMPDYCAGIDLVNSDMKYVRKWLGEILDDN